jgi:hypothetical protein
MQSIPKEGESRQPPEAGLQFSDAVEVADSVLGEAVRPAPNNRQDRRRERHRRGAG